MKVFYVFGESANDTSVLVELVLARANADRKVARAVPLRQPLIQQKGGSTSTRKTNAERIAATVKARMTLRDERPVVVVAHEDCDQVEPAHEEVSEKIERGLARVGVPIVAAAPAYEMEAWWYLWPDAVAAVCSSWRRLGRTGTEVGRLENAKETLMRDLRPKGGRRVRDYNETDAPEIAKKVRALGIIDERKARSKSFDIFEKKLKCCLSS